MPKVVMLNELERKYKKNPDGLAFAALGEAYRKRGDYKKALKILKRHLPYHPDYLLANITLAKCYFETGLFEEAQQVILPFVEKNKENIQLQTLSGDIYLKLNLDELAQNSYKRVLFYKPKCKETYKKLTEIEEKLSPVLKNDNKPTNIENWMEVSSSEIEKSNQECESSVDFMDYFDQKMENFNDHFISNNDEDVFKQSFSDESALTELTFVGEKPLDNDQALKNINIDMTKKHKEFSEKIQTFLVLLASRKPLYKVAS